MQSYDISILCFSRVGDLDGAQAEYRTVIEIDPRHMGAHNNLVILLKKRGDWAGAEKEYVRVLELDPANANAKKFLPIVRKNMRT